MSEITPISPTELATILGIGRSVVIDVRDNSAFTVAHVDKAINLTLPRMLWKRFVDKRAIAGSLQQMMITPAILSPLATLGDDDLVILYDQSSTSIDPVDTASPLCVYAHYFDICGFNVCYVSGGFAGIKQDAPEIPVSNIFSSSVFVGISIPASIPESIPASIPTFTVSDESVEVQTNDADFINDFLAVGAETTAHNIKLLEDMHVTHVLNMTTFPVRQDVAERFVTMQIDMLDSAKENLLSKLEAALTFIESARNYPNGKILVHCHAGISRSVSIAVAYLMLTDPAKNYDMTDSEVVDNMVKVVTARRSKASPNLNFCGQLMIFARALKQTRSCDIQTVCKAAIGIIEKL